MFQGCQFKEHVPVLNSPRDIEVHKLFMKHQNLITLEPQKLQLPERVVRVVSSRGKHCTGLHTVNHMRNNILIF